MVQETPARSVWQRLHGHRRQIEMFRRAAGRDRLSQAYLFAGPDGVGKRTFARLLLQCLFCERHEEVDLEACGTCGSCRRILSGSHPDFFTLGLPEGKRELPIAAFLGEDNARGRSGLCYELSLRPANGNRRVAIIDNADSMNDSAANAFLKTLEEPQPGAVLILIAAQPDRLLPTIRSRCQTVQFGPLTDSDVCELLLEQELTSDPAAAQAVALLAEGSLETAVQLLDPNLQALRLAVIEELGRHPFDSGKTAERLIKAVEPAGELAAQREATGWLARFAAEFFRAAGVSLAQPEPQGPAAAFARRLSHGGSEPELAIDTLADLTDRAAKIEDQLDLYTNPGLCIEAFAHELAGRLRATERVFS